MSSLGWLALVAGGVYLCWLIFLKKKRTNLAALNEISQPIEAQIEAEEPIAAIQPGFQIYSKRVLVAGIGFRKEAALKFVQSSGKSLVFEREASNTQDANAIKVIGISGANQYFLGYVPAEAAEQIVGSGLSDVVRARLERAHRSENGYFEVSFQVVGPKSQKQDYLDFLKTKPASPEQKEFYKFFSLAVPRGLTVGQAKAAIDTHMNMLSVNDKSELLEWEAFESICSEVEDVDFASEYEVKKISRTMLREALAALKAEGMTMVAVSDDIDILVDKIIVLKPSMKRAEL